MKYQILVLMIIAGTVNAQWPIEATTPVEREDGSALPQIEIEGFAVYCGLTIGNYDTRTFFPGSTMPTTSWVIESAPAGTSYCVVGTVDTDGRESAYSNHVTLVNDENSLPLPPGITPGQIIKVITTIIIGGSAAN